MILKATYKQFREWKILNKKNPEIYLPPIRYGDPTLIDYFKKMDYKLFNSSEYPLHPMQQIPIIGIAATILISSFILNIMFSS